MDTIYVYREKIQELYARHSRIINKAGQFILALAAFALINHNVGFMDALASPVAALGLAIICTFLPLGFTVLAATVLILAHMFAVSLGILIVTALVFLVLYIFYLRLTPKMALLVLLTPLAFFLKIPYVIKPRRAGDIATCYASAEKAEKELGWKAEYDIKDMCRDSWNWQSKNPNGYED